MDGLQTKGDTARADILAAAGRLFIANGFHGTSMRAIAREAGGRAVGGIYNHFPTKESIFIALIEESNPYDMLLSLFETTMDQVDTGPELISRVLRKVLAVMPSYYDFLQLVQIDMREFEGRNLQRLLRETFFPRVLRIIQGLQPLPGLKPIEPTLLLRMMASLVIGYVITDRLIAPDVLPPYPQDLLTDHFIDILLHGLADTSLT